MSRHPKFMTEAEVETVRRAIGMRTPINERSHEPMTEMDRAIFAEAVGIAIKERLDEYHTAAGKSIIRK